MSTVKEILKEKGNAVWSVAPDISVYEALNVMAEKNLGAVLVMKEGTLVGIFSERDYARNVIQDDRPARDILVSDLMTREITSVDPQKTMEECMALMTSKRIRHLPVYENNQVVGVISIGDVVKKIISDKQFTIKVLENYIAGG
ncbi:MAG: CBS domain-containing protein [Candidatus Omnitrophica bacterium]|nr:CBS domain-containing protein [Candidatus Omnitrophota bacterium]